MPTLVSGLLYPGAKTFRASEHLKFVNDEWRRFQDDDPYIIATEDHPEQGLHVVHVKLKPCDLRLAVAVGEFAYALRSALDQLVWQLALLSGRRPGNKSSFPIQSSDAAIDRERFAHATWNVPCEAIDIIKDLQPYVRGKSFRSHPLWQLNKLCNLDKHATIGFSHSEVNIKTSGPPGPLLHREVVTPTDTGAVVAFPLALKGKVKVEPQPPIMILGKPIEAPGPEFTMSAADLAEVHRFVREEVLPKFEKFFPPVGMFVADKSVR